MAKETLKSNERRIQTLKRRLAQVGDMRPGTLSIQYRNPAEAKRPFSQISYTYKGKSRSEYVRAESLAQIRKELDAYKSFKDIEDEIIHLSIKASRIRCSTRAT